MRLRKLALGGVLLLSVLSPLAALAADDDLDEFRTRLGTEWRLTKQDNLRNIKTYARLEEGKRYRSFKVEAELDGDVDALARVILDFDNYTKWFWETRESRLVKQISPTEYIVYMVHKAPYTLPDRDTVLRGVVEPQTRSKPYVVLRVSAMPDYLPLKPPLVRMPAEEMTIKFSPLPGNKVQMEAEGFFDPGGTVPAWAANFVQRAAPYSVVLGMQRMMAQDKYQKGRNLPFPVYSYSFYNNANSG